MFSRGQVYRLLAIIFLLLFWVAGFFCSLGFCGGSLFPMMVISYFPFGYGLLLWGHDYSIVSWGERFVRYPRPVLAMPWTILLCDETYEYASFYLDAIWYGNALG